MNLRCYLLSLLRIHRPDCARCKALEKCGLDMRERLAELNWRTQTYAACIAHAFYPFALRWTRQRQSQNFKRLRASPPTL